jgi:hypothetical protein
MSQGQVTEIWSYDFPQSIIVDSMITPEMSTDDIIELLTSRFPSTEPVAVTGGTVLTIDEEYINVPRDQLVCNPAMYYQQLYFFAPIVQKQCQLKLNIELYDTEEYIQAHGSEHGVTWKIIKGETSPENSTLPLPSSSTASPTPSSSSNNNGKTISQTIDQTMASSRIFAGQDLPPPPPEESCVKIVKRQALHKINPYPLNEHAASSTKDPADPRDRH